MSRQVWECLGAGPSPGRVLAVHKRVLDLVTGEGTVVALVAPEIGDGPLNVVLQDGFEPFGDVQAGSPVACAPDRCVLVEGAVCVELGMAAMWEPCPDWAALRAQRGAIEDNLALVSAQCLDHDPANPLLPLLGAPVCLEGREALLAERLHTGVAALKAGWQGDHRALTTAGVSLAGLGAGLTPAGDDFLAGAMLWAWLAHSDPQHFCTTLAEAAAPHTTTLSAAFLHAAARGQCSATWHCLLGALQRGGPLEIAGAAHTVLAHGASSGQDAVIGFLYPSGVGEALLCR